MNSSVRGIRNNNPFNIVKSCHNWIGKIKGVDPKFETFDTMYHGIRAGLKLLITYVERGIDTPKKIIARFAPAAENNVDNYVYYICRDSRNIFVISPDERIKTFKQFCHICSRICKYENGLNYAESSNFMLLPEQLREIIDKYDLNKNLVLTD